MLRSTIVLNIFGFLSVSFLVVQAESQKNSPEIIETFMKNNIMSKFNESNEQHLLHQFQNRNLKWIGDILYLTMKDFKPISNENSKCERDGILYRENLLNQSLWAVQMYDSSSKYPGGLLSRNIFNLGYFDQCLKVSAKWLKIYSAYSIVTLEFNISKITDHSSGVYPNITAWEELEINNNPWINKNNKIHLAICVPNSCKPVDIQKSVEIILVPAFKFYNITTQIFVNPSMYTPSNTNSKFKPESLKIGVFFILVLLIVMIGTIYDMLLEKTGNKEKMLEILLRAFSLSSNINELINNSTDKTIFSSINCLKTMGIIIIVFGHRLTLEFSSPSENFEFIENIYTHFWLAPLKSPVGVEVFFVISGFLTFVVVINRLKEENEHHIFVIILNRLVRILPVYLTVVFLYIYILPNLSNGPLWKNIVYPEVEYCKTNWWTNVLFVNNYVNTREMCMIPAWYLACDMHFFIIGLLLINIIWRWEKIGLMIFGSIFTISIFLPAKHIYSHKLWGVMHYTQSNMSNLRDVDHFNQIYIKSHHRLMTYLVGIAAGYIYTKFKDDEFKFSKLMLHLI
ncbi:O-acyltransferase like protein-like isoform X2 [Daktulosphaira vitifoliae]|uniref:O-acyltransferase like protein-like isoform X2 n=1 Tax=Daktulosphaira vitifoliae TaxID=58002 RepID=UPI0021AA7806|nr:O-acyltransferase like protein-like isoform X2 [Daktulosphaira vitifoliae]